MELTMDHVTKKFRDKTAVNDLSLHLTPGVCGLIGENGAGKTTLMNMICSILTPTSGAIALDGVEVEKMGDAYRALLGYLPQDFGVAREFNVTDYLEYIAMVKGMTAKAGRQKSSELIEMLSLGEYRKKKVARLSGGTRRRVGIAQALLNDPKILVLDEPTTGLDPGERARFRQMIANLAENRIVFISTHIVSDVESVSTHNAIMKHGKLVAYGSTAELVAPLAGKVWSMPVPAKEFEAFSERYFVLNTRKDEADEVVVRFICDTAVAGASPKSPQLEDVFLWKYLNKKGEGQSC